MPGGSELEVKLAVPDASIFELIADDPEIRAMATGSEMVTRQFEAFYFDTPEYALLHNGFAYRVRREGEKWIATVKSDKESNGGFSTREEWSEAVEGPEADLKPFGGTFVGDRLALAVGEEKLQLLFSTRFIRKVLQLQTAGGTQIELAMDRGTIWNGVSGTPICELELELKAGSVTELLQLAGLISFRWHLLPEVKSKFARGLELLHGSGSDMPGFILRGQDNKQRVPTPLAVIGGCVHGIFESQACLLKEKASSAAVRSLRIQCRKLRSLMKFYQPLLSKESGRLHADRLRQWGTLFGCIRDIDVLDRAWMKFADRFAPVVLSPGAGYIDILRERRSFLCEDVLHRVVQGTLTRHLFEILGWLHQEQDKQSDRADRAWDPLIAKSLTLTVKELREDIRALEGTTEIKLLHRFRIRIKQLRYIQETFNEIPRYRDDEFTCVLKTLQSRIGRIHDIFQSKCLLEQFDAGSVDNQFMLEKELFLSWRGRNILENFSALAREVEEFRRVAKLRSRALAAMRTSRGAKPGHHSGPHEPGQ